MRGTGTISSSLIALACAVALVATGRAGEPDSAAHGRSLADSSEHDVNFAKLRAERHFKLFPDGGAIEITAIDYSDTVSRNLIRSHLSKAATRFAQGDFEAPIRHLKQIPPGVADLQKLKGQILYAYHPIESGGRVVISTRNARALVAIHDFLRFQITERKTGDPLDVVDAAR